MQKESFNEVINKTTYEYLKALLEDALNAQRKMNIIFQSGVSKFAIAHYSPPSILDMCQAYVNLSEVIKRVSKELQPYENPEKMRKGIRDAVDIGTVIGRYYDLISSAFDIVDNVTPIMDGGNTNDQE